jgi:hypothetical protein
LTACCFWLAMTPSLDAHGLGKGNQNQYCEMATWD